MRIGIASPRQTTGSFSVGLHSVGSAMACAVSFVGEFQQPASKSALHTGAFFRTRDRIVPIPEGSLAASDVIAIMERRGIELPAQTWFLNEPKEMTLREMKIVSDRYEQTMTLLVLPAAEPRDWQQDKVPLSEGLDDYIRSQRFSRP